MDPNTAFWSIISMVLVLEGMGMVLLFAKGMTLSSSRSTPRPQVNHSRERRRMVALQCIAQRERFSQ